MADSDEDSVREASEPTVRPVCGTEYTWCRAVPTGTGITVVSMLLSKFPNLQLLQTALTKLHNTHPILRSKLRFDSVTNTFSYVTPLEPHIQISPFDLSSTSQIIRNKDDGTGGVSPFYLIHEHELSQNTWSNPDHQSNTERSLFFVSIYTLSDEQWAVILRLHTSICDRTASVALLRELLELMVQEKGEGEGVEMEYERKCEVSSGIEDFIPSGKANKPLWARGFGILGYSLNSFRVANISFVDTNSPRYSQVVRLQLNAEETNKLLAGCKSRGIKLCAALTATGLIAARSSKDLPDHQMEKYAVVTLIDCRSILEPVLSSNHLGFYHSAILNTHDVSADENLWELAMRSYTSFANAKNYNKHFTDLSDLNFLMCKAIENPGLTPSSCLRTAFISVFEEPVINESNEFHQVIGLEDYIGCGSAHGVGPSVAIFDTIHDGRLDCAFVYPSPLHSREQIQKLADQMKRILVECGETEE